MCDLMIDEIKINPFFKINFGMANGLKCNLPKSSALARQTSFDAWQSNETTPPAVGRLLRAK
ncbi:protein of unassigned function [Methylobacterium oryzae CBMB20]|uniref:Protein of unassigned function n=1 Tax=Methylobacterium oryzae CBMB20 TaxID=693986 RepID=A0A089NPI4_9HYPH|nr:protein of unassigned function [Methylobacterium oryzae CBMB20]